MNKALWYVACGLLLGCGDEKSEQQTTSSVGSTVAELSFNEGCDTGGANFTIQGSDGDVQSPSTYDSSKCRKAYLVDVHTANESSVVQVGWGEPTPTTATDCNAMLLMQYTWDMTPVPHVALGSVSARGSWKNTGGFGGSNSCVAPIIRSGMSQNKNYRYGISARHLNADGSYVLHRVELVAYGGVGGDGGAGGFPGF
jgi:hypothetical protein